MNAERFTTPELKELERKILEAEEKILELEREIFGELRAFAADARRAHPRHRRKRSRELDVTAALAQLAAENRYTRPRFSDSGEMRIVARPPSGRREADRARGRALHPERPVPRRGVELHRHHHRTQHGRQVHLPAAGGADRRSWRRWDRSCRPRSAVLPVIDRVFTRIGASDNLARGRSTFMVEMTETAVILNTATRAQPDRARRDRARHGHL